MSAVSELVKAHNDRFGRGCPKGVLQFVGGFKAADIDKAVDNHEIEATRGKEGGFYLFGNVPTPQTDMDPSLKSRMVALIQKIADEAPDSDEGIEAITLLNEYKAECEGRKKENRKVAVAK